jgi:hypothetical protein
MTDTYTTIQHLRHEANKIHEEINRLQTECPHAFIERFRVGATHTAICFECGKNMGSFGMGPGEDPKYKMVAPNYNGCRDREDHRLYFAMKLNCPCQ